MKLSDAILKGCVGTRQIQSKYIDYFYAPTCCCVLGAAFLGSLGKEAPSTYRGMIKERLLTLFTELMHTHEGKFLFNVIVTMNDDGWSREQIAEWLKVKGL